MGDGGWTAACRMKRRAKAKVRQQLESCLSVEAVSLNDQTFSLSLALERNDGCIWLCPFSRWFQLKEKIYKKNKWASYLHKKKETEKWRFVS